MFRDTHGEEPTIGPGEFRVTRSSDHVGIGYKFMGKPEIIFIDMPLDQAKTLLSSLLLATEAKSGCGMVGRDGDCSGNWTFPDGAMVN